MMDQIAEQISLIGQRIPKPDGAAKVLGRTQYINDMVLHRMLIGKILRTDRVHARILRLDISKAAALPGVHAVITGDDTPMIGIGVNKDNPPLKSGTVRCIRDEIAAVAAETEAIADQALALIEVEYEDLPAVFDPAEELEDSAPQLHEDKPGNVGLSYNISYGDIAAGEAESDVVLDETYDLHYVTHCCMGPGCVLA